MNNSSRNERSEATSCESSGHSSWDSSSTEAFGSDSLAAQLAVVLDEYMEDLKSGKAVGRDQLMAQQP